MRLHRWRVVRRHPRTNLPSASKAGARWEHEHERAHGGSGSGGGSGGESGSRSRSGSEGGGGGGGGVRAGVGVGAEAGAARAARAARTARTGAAGARAAGAGARARRAGAGAGAARARAVGAGKAGAGATAGAAGARAEQEQREQVRWDVGRQRELPGCGSAREQRASGGGAPWGAGRTVSAQRSVHDMPRRGLPLRLSQRNDQHWCGEGAGASGGAPRAVGRATHQSARTPRARAGRERAQGE